MGQRKLVFANTMSVLLTLSLLLLGVLYVLFSKRYAYWKKRGVPYPQPTIVFGNTGAAITLRTPMNEIISNFYNEYKRYSYVGLFNLWKPALVIRDPEIIKDVLVKQFHNFHDNWIETELEVDPPLGYNPFVLQGNMWKTVRTQLTPQFTSSKIKSMFPLIAKGCKNMVDFINNKAKSNSSTIHVKDMCARFTGDNVMSCAYGMEGKSFTTEHPDAFKIGEQISSSSKVIQLKQTIGFFFPTLRKLFKTTFLGDPVPRMFWDIILETIKYREENNIVRNDFLDFLKELKTKPSPVELSSGLLVGHAFTFFVNGFETSSLTFSYALFELSLSPDVQNTARKEIEAVLEKHNETLTYEALHEMDYVENIIFETLRKHPIIQLISRVCTEEFTFPPPGGSGTGEEVVVEKGTQIFIPVVALHNDPDLYADAKTFDPDHFSEEARNSRPKSSFLGFGDGPRICLGRKFALEQVKLGLVTILSSFDLRLNNKTKLPLEKENLHVFNSPKTDIWIDFCQRS